MKPSRKDFSFGVPEVDWGYRPDGESLGSDEERRIGHAVVIAHEPCRHCGTHYDHTEGRVCL